MVLSKDIATVELVRGRWGVLVSSRSDKPEGTPRAFHLPVMADEVVRALFIRDGGLYIDGTLVKGGTPPRSWRPKRTA